MANGDQPERRIGYDEPGYATSQSQAPFDMNGALEAGKNTNAYLGSTKIRDQQMQAAMEKTVIKYDSSKDTMSVEGPTFAMTQYMEDLKNYQGVKQAYDKSIAERDARMDYMKQHPFANTLSQIAAHMAANDPNPYTRGIGQAAVSLNPSVSQLEGEKFGLLKEVGQLESQQMTRDLSLLEHEERLAEARTTHAERAKEFGLKLEEINEARLGREQHYRAIEKQAEINSKEAERHHKEWEKDFRLRTVEMGLKKGEVDATKMSNQIRLGEMSLEKIDKDIATLYRAIQDEDTKLEQSRGMISDQGQRDAADRKFGEFKTAMEQQIYRLTKIRDSVYSDLDKLREKTGGVGRDAPNAPGGASQQFDFDPATGQLKPTKR